VLPTILEARDLSKSFAGPPLFTALSFRLEKGLLAVAGRNGSGKTTLLKILASLARPESGAVSVVQDGRELSGEERRLAVGWAGPDLAFYEDFTAEENLTFFRRAAGLPAQAGDLARRLEEVVLAGPALSRRVGEFSTGMRQRLRLAFAVLFDPPILLLDEPTLGLDAEGQAAADRLIAAQRDRGAVIVASNNERDFLAPELRIELGNPA
jgi:ABC-type multidrug transport system ATPase subunit